MIGEYQFDSEHGHGFFFSSAQISDRLEGPTSLLASPYFLSALSQSEKAEA